MTNRQGKKSRQHNDQRVPALLELWGRGPFAGLSVLLLGGLAVAASIRLEWLIFAPLVLGFVALGFADIVQKSHSILRNFPVLGHLRYAMESVRPELRQYFVESDQEENPFSREKRSVIYQRAKNVLDTKPFGTRRNVYASGYDWVAHSMEPRHPEASTARVTIGQAQCRHPYNSSIFNISAMSYGALSSNAIVALSKGARQGNFFHNTGEGGVSPHHLRGGGDLVWQVGTGYFGCRNAAGQFDPDLFAAVAAQASVKMIEVKLSQGAKPGHGGILPGEKVNAEVAEIRGVPEGETVISPPLHSAFAGPTGLLNFVSQLRELSGGKPVGFKLCVGQPQQLLAIVKAMHESNQTPDFITVDGGEGGTGAAPLEFSNSVGMPLLDGLSLLHNALCGAGLRDKIKLISAGKIATAFHVLEQLALGADLCNSARGMMFALGCIQALKCNTNSCPVGVATQEPALVAGLVVNAKADRVANFHRKTVESVLDLAGTAGLSSPDDLRPHHLYRRVSPSQVKHLGQIYSSVPASSLLEGTGPVELQKLWDSARADRF